MIRDYAEKVMSGVRGLILQSGWQDYVYEVEFMKGLAHWLSSRGWPSKTKGIGYPDSSLKADMVSENDAGTCRVVCEAKQYILDYPTRDKQAPTGGKLSQQHLGIEPGKQNTGVHDVVHKLPLAKATHVAFLLVRVESRANRGTNDIQSFVKMASLDDGRWDHFSEEWTHPTDADFRFVSHLWIRPQLSGENLLEGGDHE